MRFPRDVGGQRLIDHLCRSWGYRKVSQVGSHVILASELPKHHRLPVPLHSPPGIGICKKIVREVCEAKNISQEELLRGL
jgi:predicted RNA binding protein YcfA (HicA-like mRNA interferase family)